jgi:hypothetical protein
MTNRVAHIGFPKSASTYLQRNVFSKALNYTSIDFFQCKAMAQKIIRESAFLDIDILRAQLPEGNIIFSYEGLVGNFVSGEGINSASTPAILKTLGFNKIIVVTRKDNDAWRKSVHNHHVKAGGRLSYKDFIKNPSNTLQMRQWFPEMIEHHEKLVEVYKSIFGANNVLHLRSEEIYSQRESFKMIMENFLETEVPLIDEKYNESIPKWMLNIFLFTNHFTSSVYNPSTLLKKISSGYVRKILYSLSSRKYSKFR